MLRKLKICVHPRLWSHFQWLRKQWFARVELAPVSETVSGPRNSQKTHSLLDTTPLKPAQLQANAASVGPGLIHRLNYETALYPFPPGPSFLLRRHPDWQTTQPPDQNRAPPSTLLSARNESQRQPTLNLHLARTKELQNSDEFTDDDHLFSFLRLDLDWAVFRI